MNNNLLNTYKTWRSNELLLTGDSSIDCTQDYVKTAFSFYAGLEQELSYKELAELEGATQATKTTFNLETIGKFLDKYSSTFDSMLEKYIPLLNNKKITIEQLYNKIFTNYILTSNTNIYLYNRI